MCVTTNARFGTRFHSLRRIANCVLEVRDTSVIILPACKKKEGNVYRICKLLNCSYRMSVPKCLYCKHDLVDDKNISKYILLILQSSPSEPADRGEYVASDTVLRCP
jgi:hypothetical protein